MNASRYLKIAAIAVPIALSACRGETSTKPPVHPNLNMDFQNRVEAQEENDFFTDDRAMRQPVKGTISRGGLRHNKVLYQGINDDSSFVEHNPIKETKKFLLRGQNRFNIYCSPCHGLKGDGKGIVATGGYGLVPPPSYHQDRLRNVGDGYIFSVITNGIRNMRPYAAQIPVRDRWAIVAYVRALQKSQNVNESEMAKYNIDLASMKEKAQEKLEAEQKRQADQEAASANAEITAAKGKQLAQDNACSTCHSTDGSEMTGPSWKNLYGHEVQLESGETITADEDYITESIVSPQAKIVKGFQPVMPNFSHLQSNDIKNLIAYIKSLSDKQSAGGSQADSSNTSGSNR